MLTYKYRTAFLFGERNGFGGNTFGAFPTKISKIPISFIPSVRMKQRKNFIKSDIGISSNLREITQFDFKSGKIG